MYVIQMWGIKLFQELVSLFQLHYLMVTPQPKTIFVVDEINRIKSTTGSHKADELVSLLQLYLLSGPT